MLELNPHKSLVSMHVNIAAGSIVILSATHAFG